MKAIRSLSIINVINTLVALFLLILLNIQILTTLPIFRFRYVFISVIGLFICLLGMRSDDKFYTLIGGILHVLLIISFLGIIIFGIGINYKP